MCADIPQSIPLEEPQALFVHFLEETLTLSALCSRPGRIHLYQALDDEPLCVGFVRRGQSVGGSHGSCLDRHRAVETLPVSFRHITK